MPDGGARLDCLRRLEARPLLPFTIVHDEVMRAAHTTGAAPHAEQQTVAFGFFAKLDAAVRVTNGLPVDFDDYVPDF